MKIASIIGIICALLIGIAIGYELGKSKEHPAPKTIALQFNPVSDLIVTAKKGDTVKWSTGSKPAPITFDPPTPVPCAAPTDPNEGTCTLTDSDVHKFKCNWAGCRDPGVGGGDETDFRKSLPLSATDHLNPPYTTPAAVYLSCTSGSQPIANSPLAGHTGDGFFIQFNDGTSSATFPSNTCSGGVKTLNAATPTCRIAAPLGLYNYSFNVTGCRGSGTSTLTVNPPQ